MYCLSAHQPFGSFHAELGSFSHQVIFKHVFILFFDCFIDRFFGMWILCIGRQIFCGDFCVCCIYKSLRRPVSFSKLIKWEMGTF